MKWKNIWGMVKTTGVRWWNDNTFRLGAALAYYTIFSLAPVVLIAVAIAGLFYQKQTARAELVRQVSAAAGQRVAEAIDTVAQYTQESGGSTWATVFGFVFLFFGATTAFAELQSSLNLIWGVKPKDEAGWWALLKTRFWSFMVVVGIGVLLLALLLLSAVLTIVAQIFPPSSLPGGLLLWRVLNGIVSFVLVTVVFALIYKLLPDVHVDWEDVWVGALATAVLFVIGKYLIGLYLGSSSWISGYGAAGSLVVVLLWVYYSSQIFLLGAEFTYVYASEAGKPLAPKEHAEAATEEAKARLADHPPIVPPCARAGLGTPAPHRLRVALPTASYPLTSRVRRRCMGGPAKHDRKLPPPLLPPAGRVGDPPPVHSTERKGDGDTA